VTPEIQPPAVSRHEFRIAFSGLLLTLALAALDQNIVSTALPQIVGDLGGLDHLSWVVSAFLLTSTISAPLYGKLSDLYGRRPLFVVAIGIFLGGSMLCGLAQNMIELIVFRGVQGLGAGGLITLSSTTIADLVGSLGRARYQGFFTGVFALCSVAGPLLGGVITDTLSWRWIFYVNLPLGALALVLIMLGLRRSNRQVKHRIDYAGAVLLSAGTTAMLLMLSWAGAIYPWASPQVIGLIGISLILFALLIRQERRAPEPLLPPRLFGAPVFRVAALTTALASIALLGATLFLPLFFQLVMGASPSRAGLLIAPLMAGVVVSSVLGGRIVVASGRTKPLTVIGLGVASLSYLGLAWGARHQAGLITLETALVMVGLGLGAAMPNLTTAIQNGVAPADLGVATSSSSFFRSIGGALGVALAGAMLTMTLQSHLHTATVALPTLAEQARQQAGSLAAVQSGPVIEAYREGIAATFLGGGIVLGLACLCSLMLPGGQIGSSAKQVFART